MSISVVQHLSPVWWHELLLIKPQSELALFYSFFWCCRPLENGFCSQQQMWDSGGSIAINLYVVKYSIIAFHAKKSTVIRMWGSLWHSTAKLLASNPDKCSLHAVNQACLLLWHRAKSLHYHPFDLIKHPLDPLFANRWECSYVADWSLSWFFFF